jgi:hypothetical protein
MLQVDGNRFFSATPSGWSKIIGRSARLLQLPNALQRLPRGVQRSVRQFATAIATGQCGNKRCLSVIFSDRRAGTEPLWGRARTKYRARAKINYRKRAWIWVQERAIPRQDDISE